MSLDEAMAGNVTAQAALADECLSGFNPLAPGAAELLAQAKYWTCLALTRGDRYDKLRAATLMITTASYEARLGWSDTAISRTWEAMWILDELMDQGIEEAGIRLEQLVASLPAHIVAIITAMRLNGVRITPTP